MFLKIDHNSQEPSKACRPHGGAGVPSLKAVSPQKGLWLWAIPVREQRAPPTPWAPQQGSRRRVPLIATLVSCFLPQSEVASVKIIHIYPMDCLWSLFANPHSCATLSQLLQFCEVLCEEPGQHGKITASHFISFFHLKEQGRGAWVA